MQIFNKISITAGYIKHINILKLVRINSNVCIKSIKMFKISILTIFLLFLTILVLSTSAKPTNPEENTEYDEYKKLMDARKAAEPICKEKYKKNVFILGENVKHDVKNDEYCYQRCMFEKTGHMKNNEIDLDQILKSFEIFKNSGVTIVTRSDKELAAIKKCVKKTNSKNLEGYCEPLKDLMECVEEEQSATQNS